MSKLDKVLITKAVKELIKFVRRENESGSKNALIEEYNAPISVQLQLLDGISEEVLRPVRVKIPNSMYSPDQEEHSVCLFCRTEDKEPLEAFFKVNPFEGLTGVVSLGDVKKQYKAFKDRKELLGRYTHFICDVAIVSHLYNLLGKVFSQRNNFPVPITVEKCFQGNTKILNNIRQCVDSTYVKLKGAHITIRLGHVGMSVDAIVNNVAEGVEFLIENKVKNNWRNIHSVHIKTPTSASLPLYYRHNKEVMGFLTAPVEEVAVAPKTPAKAVESESTATKSTKKGAKTPVAAPVVAPVTPAPVAVVATPKAAKTTTKTPAKIVQEEEVKAAPKSSKKRATVAEEDSVEEVAPPASAKKARVTRGSK